MNFCSFMKIADKSIFQYQSINWNKKDHCKIENYFVLDKFKYNFPWLDEYGFQLEDHIEFIGSMNGILGN